MLGAMVLACTLAAFSAAPADASRAVRRTITGCVVAGTLVSDDGYRIRVTDSRSREPVDLARYEGRRIRWTGSLLPGDVYFVTAQPVVLGRCR